MQKGASKPFAPNAGLQKGVHRGVKEKFIDISSAEVSPRMLPSPDMVSENGFKGASNK